MEPAGTIADRAYAPKPGAPARPAIVRCKKLASGWLAEVEPGETLLTQKRKHYRLHCEQGPIMEVLQHYGTL
jgi:hypothetical protein